MGSFALISPALAQESRPWFTDVTATALPDVCTVSGDSDKDYIVEVNGGGIGLADLDLDGDLDLVVVDGSTLALVGAGRPGLPPRVYLNDGQGHFAPAGETWCLPPGRWGTGLAIGDVDNDGDPDLVVLAWGPDRLFLNEAGAGFVAGPTLPTIGEGDAWSTSGAFLDYDGDGTLDLFVARYLVPDLTPEAARAGRWKGQAVMRGPQGLQPVGDRLLRGIGAGRFEDVTEASGIGSVPPGFGLGVMPLDFDEDGRCDVFVANDSTPNHLWRNRGDGTFEELGLRAGVSHDGDGRAQASMGIAVGDLGGEGREALFVTNFSSEANTLYEPSRPGVFRDRTSRRGLVAPCLHLLGWGTGMLDVELDGDLDLWVLNGHVYPEADSAGTDTSYAQADLLLVQREDGRFEPRALADGPARVSRAGVHGDLDRDGDLDLITHTLDGPVLVLRNDAPRPVGARWLGVRLGAQRGADEGLRQVLGARFTLHVGDQTLARVVRTAGGFQAAVPAEVHFSFLDAEPDTEGPRAPPRLAVTWPDGAHEVLGDVEPDAWRTVERTVAGKRALDRGRPPGKESPR